MGDITTVESILFRKYEIYLTYRYPFPINGGPQNWECDYNCWTDDRNTPLAGVIRLTLEDLDLLEHAEVALCRFLERLLGSPSPRKEPRCHKAISGFLAENSPQLCAKHRQSLRKPGKAEPE